MNILEITINIINIYSLFYCNLLGAGLQTFHFADSALSFCSKN